MYMNGRDFLYCISVQAFDLGASVMGIHSGRHVKTNSVSILTGQFPQKSPIINGSFSEKTLQLEACYALLPPLYETPYVYALERETESSHACARARKRKPHIERE